MKKTKILKEEGEWKEEEEDSRRRGRRKKEKKIQKRCSFASQMNPKIYKADIYCWMGSELRQHNFDRPLPVLMHLTARDRSKVIDAITHSR